MAAFTVASLLMLLASGTEPVLQLKQASRQALEPVRAAVAGAGQGVVIPLALEAVLSGLDSEHAGLGAGIVSTIVFALASVFDGKNMNVLSIRWKTIAFAFCTMTLCHRS